MNLIVYALIFSIPTIKKAENSFSEEIEVVTEVSSRSLEEPRTAETFIEEEEVFATHISEKGMEFIKSHEWFISKAKKYKGEKYYTIGYGHYGKDVKSTDSMTREEAEELFLNDMPYYEARVNELCGYMRLNQNEFDALMSFCYNLGEGNLAQLTAGKTRTKEEVIEHIAAYTGSGNEANRKGLESRRNDEIKLFKGEW